MLYQIMYSSRATKGMSVGDLEQILTDARARNEANNMTGALIYVDDVFFQVLEGDKEAVLALVDSIKADTRHADVTVFYEAEIAQRTFGDWRMAYLSATPEQVSAWAGLPGTATVDSLLRDLDRDSGRASRLASGILRALVP